MPPVFSRISRRVLRILLIALWVLAATPNSGLAQTPAEPSTPAALSMDLQESIDVIEIQLEVLVKDGDGRIVDGLTSADFERLLSPRAPP